MSKDGHQREADVAMYTRTHKAQVTVFGDVTYQLGGSIPGVAEIFYLPIL